MVVAYHLIWTAYGWWLPNDPRGSSSHEIRVERIADLGELHHGRKAVQPLPAELRAFYAQAQKVLKHPLLTFRDQDIQTIADSFAKTIQEATYTCYACAVMPDHIHMLIRRHRDKAEQMINRFQNDSREALIRAATRGMEHPTCGGPGWKVFLNTQLDVERVIRYIRANPINAGWPEQIWPFVKTYDGWLPRPAKR
jgi:REP element-mobilizing transposase RayT